MTKPKRPEPILSKDMLDKTLRLVLRSIPLLPGPEMYDLVLSMKKSRGDLGDKVRRAADALSGAASIVDELEEALKKRSKQMDKIRVEYERLSTLTDIEEEKAGPILKQVELTLNQGKQAERWISLGLNLFAGVVVFVVGVLVGPWLTSALGVNTP